MAVGSADRDGAPAAARPDLAGWLVVTCPLAPTIGCMSLDFTAYSLSPEHEALRESVRQLADDKIAPYAAQVDQRADPQQFWSFSQHLVPGQSRPSQAERLVPLNSTAGE